MKTERDLIKAAEKMDWDQVVMNGGPPCFHLEDGKFCGRAQRWQGHYGAGHSFVPLALLLKGMQHESRKR